MGWKRTLAVSGRLLGAEQALLQWLRDMRTPLQFISGARSWRIRWSLTGTANSPVLFRAEVRLQPRRLLRQEAASEHRRLVPMQALLPLLQSVGLRVPPAMPYLPYLMETPLTPSECQLALEIVTRPSRERRREP